MRNLQRRHLKYKYFILFFLELYGAKRKGLRKFLWNDKDKLYSYYSDPEKRGYLANPAYVEQSRMALFEKYGKEYKKPEHSFV